MIENPEVLSKGLAPRHYSERSILQLPMAGKIWRQPFIWAMSRPIAQAALPSLLFAQTITQKVGRGSALHARKGLAVSLLNFAQENQELWEAHPFARMLRLFQFAASLLAPLSSAINDRQGLPATLPVICNDEYVFGLSSPWNFLHRVVA